MNKSERLLNNIEMYEMANLPQRSTGLPMIIWISGKTGGERHAPRIKIQKTHTSNVVPNDWYSMSISDKPTMIPPHNLSPDDVELCVQFVTINKELLLKYWNHEMTTVDFLDKVKKV